jgi:hypothetical protein
VLPSHHTATCARPFYHYEDDKAQQKKRLCVAYVAPGVSLLRHQKVVHPLSFTCRVSSVCCVG